MGRWFTYFFISLPDSTAPPTVRIVHSGLACNIEEERYSERVYTIREGETLELTCLVTGHPRPQVSPDPRHWGKFNLCVFEIQLWGCNMVIALLNIQN